MKHTASPLLSFPRIVSALAFALCLGAAHADDYADVNLLLRQGKPTEALNKADAYIVNKPRDPQMRFLRGVILTEQGKQAEATTAFTQLTQDFPELPEPYNNLAALYAGQGDFDKARIALEMAMRLNPVTMPPPRKTWVTSMPGSPPSPTTRRNSSTQATRASRPS